MEKTENIEEKRMKLIEGGVERCGPLRCQFTTYAAKPIPAAAARA